MPPNPFDQACRYLLRRCPALLLWLLGATQEKVLFIRWLTTKLTIPGFPERENDMIAHVRRQDQGGKPWAIPTEFQVEPDALMFGRFLVYEGLVWLLEKPTEHPGDRFNLLGLVVNLTGIGTTGQDMDWGEDRGTGLKPIERNLQSYSASDVLDQIVAGKAPRAALALIPLMIGGKEPGTMQRWREVAEPETDLQWRADFCLACGLAELTGCQEDWETTLEGFVVRQSVVVNEWKAEASGRMLCVVLKGRFGPLPDEVAGRIARTTDINLLERWGTLAGEASTLEEFRQKASL
jgi:hypothetical protein